MSNKFSLQTIEEARKKFLKFKKSLEDMHIYCACYYDSEAGLEYTCRACREK